MYRRYILLPHVQRAWVFTRDRHECCPADFLARISYWWHQLNFDAKHDSASDCDTSIRSWGERRPGAVLSVDLEKRFEMANTAARQVRYSATDSDNAAVYLETILRNARWSDIVHEYGDGDDGGSSIRRSRPASGSSGGGIDWLASVPDAFVDVVSEAALWRSKNTPR
ncbi:hypothetical protein DYB25_013575 [Aphanomyces astaci]|nr:hypothetical protein DYB25_013575 [Aphanomyces astaci]RHY02700.1 hypothetical protein DYB36_006364 [Aphanomyces astaci]RHY73254.1 hypothetical protein DYB38_011105 [Aphanomyces astaci]RHZ11550.1 hypothetical protein DYB26_004277 [Aphanomyces astaci]RHZ23264.1 hypothetical protein DYB31_006912 [Aphanomyces astaci]